MTNGLEHSPLPWRLEARELGAGKALLVLAANGDLIAYGSHGGQVIAYLTEEGRQITRTPEQMEGNYSLLVRAVNASKTLVDVCAGVASQLRQASQALRQEGRAGAAESMADLAGALEDALGKVTGRPAEKPPEVVPTPDAILPESNRQAG
jgi:hypothetical protein